jgi:hypothetical protein
MLRTPAPHGMLAPLSRKGATRKVQAPEVQAPEKEKCEDQHHTLAILCIARAIPPFQTKSDQEEWAHQWLAALCDPRSKALAIQVMANTSAEKAALEHLAQKTAEKEAAVEEQKRIQARRQKILLGL